MSGRYCGQRTVVGPSRQRGQPSLRVFPEEGVQGPQCRLCMPAIPPTLHPSIPLPLPPYPSSPLSLPSSLPPPLPPIPPPFHPSSLYLPPLPPPLPPPLHPSIPPFPHPFPPPPPVPPTLYPFTPPSLHPSIPLHLHPPSTPPSIAPPSLFPSTLRPSISPFPHFSFPPLLRRFLQVTIEHSEWESPRWILARRRGARLPLGTPLRIPQFMVKVWSRGPS